MMSKIYVYSLPLNRIDVANDDDDDHDDDNDDK